jgi:DNA-binding CsgD family transcriptional regulator
MERVDDVRQRAALLLPIANPLVTLASPEAGLAFSALVAALPAGSPDLLGPLAAQALIAGGQPGPPRALAEALARPGGYELLVALAVVAAAGPSRERAIRLARRCVVAGRVAGADVRWPATVSAMLALCLSWVERLDEAWYWSTHAIRTATDSRSVTGHAFALSVRVDVAMRRGQLRVALAAGQEALRLHAATGTAPLRAAVAARLVRIMLERGEPNAAEPLLAEAGSAATTHLLSWVEYLHARGLYAMARGRPREALRLHLECGELLAARGVTGPSWVPWRDRAVLAQVRLGDLGTAWSSAREAVRVARSWGAPGRLGGTLTAAASAAPDSAVRIALLREAVEVLDGTESALERAHALIRLGAALLAVGDQNGRAILARGAQLAAECEATAIAMRARQRLTGRTDRSGPDASALSPAERRVADLVLRGMNNAEVAAALLISKRTVDTHLGRIYRKLNIRSRAKLAEALTPSGGGWEGTRAGRVNAASGLL